MTRRGSSVDDRDVVAEFAARVAAGSPDIDTALTEAALAALQRHLRHRFPGMGREDLTDAVNESVARLAATAHTGRVRDTAAGGRPGGYLLRTAENLLIDQLRSARWAREQPIPHEVIAELVLTDDETTHALDRRATTDMVRRAMSEVQAGGDATLFRIATYLLDTVQRTGRVPSNRRTAAACGVSHTTVAEALRKLRRYFRDQPAN